MAKKIILTLLGLVCLIGLLGWSKLAQFKAMSAQSSGPQPDSVSTAEVKEERWQPTYDAVGSITAVQGVVVSAEVAGKITRIAFESGAEVKAGDLLIELDTSTEQAQLRSAEAAAQLAEVSLVRARDLLEKQSTSQADLDAADAQSKSAQAQLENIRAVIAKKTIRAPFTGRVGIRQANLGQYLGSGDPIVVLQSLDPVYVDFSLTQQRVSQLAVDLDVRVTSDAFADHVFGGKITAINPSVDPVTRSVKIQATLANPEHRLLPGMFANVAVMLPTQQRVITIPITAVIYATFGDSVYVVEDAKEGGGKVVRQQFVRLGEARGDFVAVTQGLKPGEIVVGTGAFKLHNGAPVVIHNEYAPKPELAPKPVDA